ncbi:carbohydrate ABC transporter permease [Sulfoacidibacillus thermotolerans]|uniref:Sugar ABC transporter permease n=1 Tax=Sulfoacidibacillus thermotolerans TaxID=1765684 RepID=A0A2U3D823_SULT2|nr:sugar ABC transporter permease [Sulfoacidibacillus thermotolerans]PWI57427.1 sugar ABC transporter permease [Sulfoacidibacillus thermotolerans]
MNAILQEQQGGKRRSQLGKSDRRAGYLMLFPALLIIGAITIFPILYSMYMSFNHVTLTENGFQLQFNAGKNYDILIHSSVYWHSVEFTVMYAVVTVVVELVLGLLIALAVNNVQRLKNLSLVVMLIPWALITVISAQMWDYIYNGVYGILNYLLQSMHLIQSPVTWLGTSTSAIIAMMVADIWKTTPFVVIILLGGLQMIPEEYYEAAYMDGANRWQSFWKVTLPLLRGSIALAGLFRILQAFGVFDLPFVLTGGGPGDATQSLAILGYEILFQNLQFGRGSAIAVSTVLLVLFVCLVFLSAFRSLVKGEDA